jgi:hypothetical protein
LGWLEWLTKDWWADFDGCAVAVGFEWDQIDVLATELNPSSEQLTPYWSLARIP